jgi:hypothetical protein
MNYRRSFGPSIVTIMLLVLGHVISWPSAVSANEGVLPTNVPTDIEVPAGNVLLFWNHAKGVQTYECTDGKWTFRAPRARIIDPHSGRLAALHYGGIDRNRTPGPWWDAVRDSSRIRAGNAVSAPSPNANSIPLLRLQVLEQQGSGMFSPVRYIQRLNTGLG